MPLEVKETTWPLGKFATTKPSRDSDRLSGLVRPVGESSDRSRSPKVVCTRIGPSVGTWEHFSIGKQAGLFS